MDIIMKGSKDDILVKDCPDFIPLEDGTIIKEKKYCDLSFKCKQIGYRSEYCQFFDAVGELVLQEYLCTGKRIRKEDAQDEEAAH